MNVSISKKRNFSITEKHLLFSLIEKYKNVIENKKTNGTNNEEKNKCWDKITQEFNASCPDSMHRTSVSLKKLYYNSKREVKKVVAEERIERLLTGGGPSKSNSNVNPNKELLLSLMSEKSVHGLHCKHDSNSNRIRKNSTNLEAPVQSVDPTGEILQDENENFEVAENHAIKKQKRNDETITESLLETPMYSKNFSTSRRRPTTIVKTLTSSDIAEKYNLLLDERLPIAKLEKEKLTQEIEWAQEEISLKRQSLLMDMEYKQAQLKKLNNNGRNEWHSSDDENF